jgi:DNA polymerase V
VGAIALENRQYQQQDMFSSTINNPELMNCYDSINRRYGNGSIEIAAVGKKQIWQMRRNFLSPAYTSCWQDITKIIC